MTKPIDAFFVVGNVPDETLTPTILIYKRDNSTSAVASTSMVNNGGGHYSYLVNDTYDDGTHKYTIDGGSGITNNLERYKWGVI